VPGTNAWQSVEFVGARYTPTLISVFGSKKIPAASAESLGPEDVNVF
jgi:hypothetical protein